MGIDSQGINRGKCSCGECVEFVRGSGVLCGYCECVPVRHEKVTDPNSSTTSATQDGQTTQPRNNLWNDVSLGWIPDPKGDYTRFSNSLLAEFYQCFWATCPFKENFRLEFIKERKRQWSILSNIGNFVVGSLDQEMIERANNKVSYITSINPAAAGKFLHQNFQAKEHDSITISYNIDALVKAKGKLESLNKEITEQDNALFMANGLRLMTQEIRQRIDNSWNKKPYLSQVRHDTD